MNIPTSKALTSNTLIRNIIIAFDFLLLWTVFMLLIESGKVTIARPVSLILLATVSLMIAELGFSTVIHQHYQTVDKMLKRTISLCMLFSLTLFLLISFHKWTLGVVMPSRTLGAVCVLYSILVLTARIVERMLIRFGRRKGRNSRQLIFVGDTQYIHSLIHELDTSRTTGLRLTGYFSDRRDDRLSTTLPYLGDYDDLREAMAEDRQLAEDIYCSLPTTQTDLINEIASHCMKQAARFYYLPPFMDTFGYFLTPKIIGNTVVFTNFSEPVLQPANKITKRLFDICLSATIILCTLPLFPIVALIIMIQSPGPIFFKQKRTGLNGKDFYIYKFRSMHVNADADKLQCTKDDPRKFAFGNLMRKTNIDELPQFFNVLRGDMSIVGPRPHMLKHTEEYRHKIPEYMIRHYVRPGITGWAQTNGFRGETKELWQMEGRVKRDIWYIQNWSLWLDIRIILRTAYSIIHPDKEAT